MSYKTILEMPANELATVLKTPTLVVRRIPDKEWGGSAISYNANGEKYVVNQNISTCLDHLGGPKEFLLVGNSVIAKSDEGAKTQPEPMYAAFRGGILLENENVVLEFANKCYEGLRAPGVTKDQVDAYIKQLDGERGKSLKEILEK